MSRRKLACGQKVKVPWGLVDVRGHVQEVYGEGPSERGVVLLRPEESSYVVDEPTTVVFPPDEVTPVDDES